MIRKSCATVKVLQFVAWLLFCGSVVGQETATKDVEVPQPVASDKAEVTYPRAVSMLDDGLLVVDLDLPGVWLDKGNTRSLFLPGTKLLRKPMNRPWCVAPHPGGGILVGDSATREIYACVEPGTKLKALNQGYLGIPMALAVSPDQKTLYVGDAERRSVFRLPIEGGKPELVVRVNARGLSFDGDGTLWAVTPRCRGGAEDRCREEDRDDGRWWTPLPVSQRNCLGGRPRLRHRRLWQGDLDLHG